MLFDLENLLEAVRDDPIATRRAFRGVLRLITGRPGQYFGAAAAATDRCPRPTSIWSAILSDLPAWIRPCFADRRPDAADHALTQWLRNSAPGLGYQRLTIVSGDHHFTPVAQQERASGKETVVIGCHGSVSSSLLRTADRIHLVAINGSGRVSRVRKIRQTAA